jgi:hypothetical protein
MPLDKLLAVGAPLGMMQAGARELVPDGAAEDIIGLIGDDGLPFKRGGSSFKSNAAFGAAGLLGLWDGVLAGGRRTLFIRAAELGTLAADDATPQALTGSGVSAKTWKFQRPVSVHGLLFVVPATPAGSEIPVAWAGSRKTGPYSAGTVTVTQGSRTVTGAGTAWLANADAGMLFQGPGGSGVAYAVESINSDTSLTLAEPWPEASAAGGAYILSETLGFDSPTVALGGFATLLAATQYRLLFIRDRRLAFSGLNPRVGNVMSEEDVHEFPSSIIGAAGLRDTAFVFTQSGLYSISNMAYDLTDQLGDPQQRIDHLNPELVLWGHEGIATWAGALVIPALDNVWLLDGISAPVPIGGPILDLYLSYVQAGYVPGVAEVYNGHYFLPIVAGSTVADVLVCRLRPARGGEGPAWSRLSGTGALAVAFAERTTNPPKLLAAQRTAASRVLDATSFFLPTAAVKNDPDGTPVSFTYTSRAFSTGNMVANFVERVRVRYELVDAASDNPTVTCEVSIDGGAWATLQRRDGSGTTAPESDGSSAYSWRIREKCRDVRVRLTVAGPAAEFTLKSCELFLRHSARY